MQFLCVSSTLRNGQHPDLPIKSISHLRSRWDWSKVKAKLVPSLSGKHEGWNHVQRIGHMRLRKIIRDMNLPPARRLVVECQVSICDISNTGLLDISPCMKGSSIGSYTTQWLNEFYRSAIGVDNERWLDQPLKRRQQQDWPPVKIVFPSLRTVQATVLGPPVCL
jgi:tyrosyl-DNA phosphodiesterase 1